MWHPGVDCRKRAEEGRVQRWHLGDWNTAGAPPSLYTARQLGDSEETGRRKGKRRKSEIRKRREDGIGSGKEKARRNIAIIYQFGTPSQRATRRRSPAALGVRCLPSPNFVRNRRARERNCTRTEKPNCLAVCGVHRRRRPRRIAAFGHCRENCILIGL